MLLLTSCSGCATMHYLLQAAGGQLALINHARPIPEVLKDEKVPPRIKVLLSEIKPIKDFGEKNGLKPTRNYQDYVKLDRPVAIWVVSACERLRFQSKEWSFPFLGSFPYLGWFDLNDAKKFRDELKEKGWDVDLRGAGAYSTLGWFRDAVLSSMIPEGGEALGELVNVVIHESVHATIYLKGQAYFNESIASYVADNLTDSYLTQTRGAASPEKKAYDEAREKYERYVQSFHQAYEKLSAVYASKSSDLEKAAEKSRILAEVKDKLKLTREINNASLIEFKEYHSNFGDFEKVFEMCGKDYRRFLDLLKRKLPPEAFSKTQDPDLGPVLKKLLPGGC